MSEDPDFDEDLYEETTSKVVYKRSLPSHQELLEEDDQDSSTAETGETNRFGGTDDFYNSGGEDEQIQQREPSTRNRMEMDEADDNVISKYEWNIDARNREDKGAPEYDSKMATPERMHSWSDRVKRESAKEDRPQKTFPVRPDFSDYSRRTKEPEEHGDYFATSKWEVDYTNKNYIRSKCNKPAGLHRYILGRPQDWNIDYDNSYYLRSQVNAPRGLHRRVRDIERKRVPDEDILADATGWEFEYGPEFDQLEEDVPYMPEEYIITRGAYRCYGVKRNDSDSDRKKEEKQNKINDLIEDEMKYGAEFLQDDVPHVIEQKDRRIGRGAYRYYDVPKNIHDKYPEDAREVDYRTSRASIHKHLEESDEDQDTRKGKPFKRTVLKKTFFFGKPDSDERSRYGTHLSFVPGEGSKTFYEGLSTRLHGTTEPPNVRNIFRPKKVSSYSRHTDSKTANSPESRPSKRDYWEKAKRTTGGEISTPRTLHGSKNPRQAWEEGKGKISHEKEYPLRNSRPKDEDNSFRDERRRSEERNNQRRKREEKNSKREVKSKDPWNSPQQKSNFRRKTENGAFDKDYTTRDNRKQPSPRSFSGSNVGRKRLSDEMIGGVPAGENRFNRQRMEHSFPGIIKERKEVLKKLPPHIESRIQILRKRMSRPELPVTDQKHGKGSGRHRNAYIDDEDEFDFRKHKNHPHDHAKSFKDGFEKYVNENGSEIWVKTEEKYSELHHRQSKPKF